MDLRIWFLPYEFVSLLGWWCLIVKGYSIIWLYYTLKLSKEIQPMPSKEIVLNIQWERFIKFLASSYLNIYTYFVSTFSGKTEYIYNIYPEYIYNIYPFVYYVLNTQNNCRNKNTIVFLQLIIIMDTSYFKYNFSLKLFPFLVL